MHFSDQKSHQLFQLADEVQLIGSYGHFALTQENIVQEFLILGKYNTEKISGKVFYKKIFFGKNTDSNNSKYVFYDTFL